MAQTSSPLPLLAFAAALCVAPLAAQAVEYPIGAPENRYGMEIGAVYLQPVRMEPDGMMLQPDQSDIHLEADIHALQGNPNGYPEGFWIPFLLVTYEMVKEGSGEVIKGELMPMVASDGPHYGDNVKLPGPGKYKMTYTIYPPNAPENHYGKHYGRHTDRATGVRPWFSSFKLDYDFVFAGVGKKGGY